MQLKWDRAERLERCPRCWWEKTLISPSLAKEVNLSSTLISFVSLTYISSANCPSCWVFCRNWKNSLNVFRKPIFVFLYKFDSWNMNIHLSFIKLSNYRIKWYLWNLWRLLSPTCKIFLLIGSRWNKGNQTGNKQPKSTEKTRQTQEVATQHLGEDMNTGEAHEQSTERGSSCTLGRTKVQRLFTGNVKETYHLDRNMSVVFIFLVFFKKKTSLQLSRCLRIHSGVKAITSLVCVFLIACKSCLPEALLHTSACFLLLSLIVWSISDVFACECQRPHLSHVKFLGKKASVKKEWTEDLLISSWDWCITRGSMCWLLCSSKTFRLYCGPPPPVRHCYELVYYSSCRMIKVLLPMLRLSSLFSMYMTGGILKPHTSFWEAVIMK